MALDEYSSQFGYYVFGKEWSKSNVLKCTDDVYTGCGIELGLKLIG